MLLSDDDNYPRGYGLYNDLMFYLVLAPGMHPMWVAGYRDWDYEATKYSRAFQTEEQLLDSNYSKRVPVPKRLAQQARRDAATLPMPRSRGKREREDTCS